ncbi:MAG TPA: phenylalanine--tRNA ligase subunit alpha, partial [Thermoanaerobaculia bacterium]|nr:phenylalanine--tRNA ligase subunit alpha [Thermoanaerobaculia bacterium]
MIEKIRQTESEFRSAIAEASTVSQVEEIRTRWFGRKGGIVPALFGELKKVPPEQKKEIGEALNRLRDELETELDARLTQLRAEENVRKERFGAIDVTLPARLPQIGHLHPTTIVRRQIETIFREMGYSVEPGPEIETDWYNFGALNFTPEHPARDTQDTFYLSNELLLRTHTSNVQIRFMEAHEPPIKVLAPGRVFRRDEITL